MTGRLTAVTGLRMLVAGMAAAIAGIHLDLWGRYGYRHIPTIGALFLLNVVAGFLLAVGSLVAPRRIVAVVWIATAGFAAATLAALMVSLNAKLFGFTETSSAPLLAPSIGVEAATVLVGAAAGLWLLKRDPAKRGR